MYLVVNIIANFEILMNDNDYVDQVESFKYMDVTTIRLKLNNQKIKSKIGKAKRMIVSVCSCWWDKHLLNEVKNSLGQMGTISTNNE